MQIKNTAMLRRAYAVAPCLIRRRSFRACRAAARVLSRSLRRVILSDILTSYFHALKC